MNDVCSSPSERPSIFRHSNIERLRYLKVVSEPRDHEEEKENDAFA